MEAQNHTWSGQRLDSRAVFFVSFPTVFHLWPQKLDTSVLTRTWKTEESAVQDARCKQILSNSANA